MKFEHQLEFLTFNQMEIVHLSNWKVKDNLVIETIEDSGSDDLDED